MENSSDVLKNIKYQKVKLMKLYDLHIEDPVLSNHDKLDILERNA